MSQNTDRSTEPQPKSPEASRPATRFLDLAIGIYLTTLAAFVGLAAFGIHAEVSQLSATVLLIVPLAFLGMIFALCYFVYFVSSLAGVPLVRFSNGLSSIQRNFGTIVGTALLLAVVYSVVTIASS